VRYTGGRSLARVGFDLGLDGPSAVGLRAAPDLGGAGSLILAVAYEDGGTGRLVAMVLLGRAGRRLGVVLTVKPATNLASVCLGGLGPREGVGAAVWTWLWGPGESHADAHRFRATVYRRSQAGFVEERTVETRGRHQTWKQAAGELGLTCQDYLGPPSGESADTALEGRADGATS